MVVKKDIRSLSIDQLKEILEENSFQSFRAKQIYHWLWKKSSHDFSSMHNLPYKLLTFLENNFVIRNIEIFIANSKIKAKNHKYDANDDYKCYKRIYAIALVFPVNEKYHRDIPEIEWQIKELWYLYYYYKYRIDGKNFTYSQIVTKYA